jgi:hypothetical protein
VRRRRSVRPGVEYNGHGGTVGFVDNGRGTGRERECILEFGDVARREGTEVGPIGGRESRGQIYEEGCGEGLVVVVYSVMPMCIARRRSVITTSKTVHGYKSNLEKTVQEEVREFFDPDALAKAWYEK